METNLETLQYPIGRFKMPATVTAEEINNAILAVAGFPPRLMDAVQMMSPDQLDTPYRQDGWTVRQVVHHVADSHMNAYTRFKLALSEETPTIKPYDQARWAQQKDYSLEPGISLLMLAAIHQRWVAIMESMSEPDWQRSFVHPETGRSQRLEQTVMLYAWHCEHHLMHIVRLKERMFW